MHNMKKLLITLLLLTPFTTFAAPTTGSFYFTNLLKFSTTTTGCLQGGTTASGIVTAYFTGSACGTGSGGGGTFPFTVNTGYNSTTTALGFLNGFFSTASSTISSSLYLPALSQGLIYTGSSGLVNSVATSSLAVGSSLSSSGTLGSQVGGTASSLSINTANTNTWSVLQNFNYSSSTIYSSFITASSTFGYFGSLTVATSSAGCAAFMSSGLLVSTGAACGSGGGGSPGGTGSEIQFRGGASTFSAISNTAVVTSGTGMFTGFGTTTPQWLLQLASSTAPQLTLTSNTNIAHWSLRNAGGNLYFATSSPTTFATSSSAAVEFRNAGTFPGFIVGSSTPNGGQNPIAVIQGYATIASTTGLLLEAVSGGGCMILKDVQGTGFTQVYAQAGFLYAKVASSISSCQ